MSPHNFPQLTATPATATVQTQPVPTQAIQTQPILVQVPVQTVQTPVPPESEPVEANEKKPEDTINLVLISHSPLVYWWPVWVVGYTMALITYFRGEQAQIGANLDWFHPSSNLGVIFLLTFFLVILITNVSVRGLASGMVVMAAILVTVLLAYFGWWDAVLAWFGNLKIHLNLGAYFWFSNLMFLVWLLSFLIFDRMSYWRIKPGQVTHEFVFGSGSRSYDTENLVLEKHRDDLFRHWILGLGSGDLLIKPYGADREAIQVPNILNIGSKIQTIQRMIATKPDAFGHSILK